MCEDNLENMYTSIFDAFAYRNKYHTDDIDIIISADGSYEKELFCDYENVVTSADKGFKTVKSIQEKLGYDIYEVSLKILCHYDEERVYVLYKFLEVCFRFGPGAVDNLQNKYVMRALELSRKVRNESHLYLGITRFQETYGVLYATIEPKCNAIPLMVGHFADRYPCENWIIHDKTRGMMAVHRKFSDVEIICGDVENILQKLFGTGIKVSDNYEDLWKVFFETIAIEERHNYKCQRNLLPLWMRSHMKEFEN